MTLAVWPGEATRWIALRLGPGEDLRGGIEEAFAEAPEQAGFVAACVGSASRLALRHAGADEASVTEGCYEVVALSGTLSVDGVHLHLAASRPDGTVTAGHLVAGTIVRTTAELVIGLVGGVRFTRPLDPETGYAELTVEAER